MRVRTLARILLLNALLAACSDETGVLPPAEVRIPWTTASLQLGDTLQLRASVLDANGNVLPDAVVTWSSSNPTIASVVTDGRLVGHQPGSVSVTASVNQLTASGAVHVVLAQSAALRITATSDSLRLGDTLRLKATLLDTKGQIVQVDWPVQWSTSDTTILSIDATGLVSARSYGSAVISAVTEGISTATTFHVRPTQAPAGISCSSPGTMHAGNVSTEIWLAANSPHYLQDTVRVAKGLTVEAGALVCAAPSAAIIVGATYAADSAKLSVIGTSEHPVVFRPRDPGTAWAGISVSGTYTNSHNSAMFSHADVESAEHGIGIGYNATAMVDYSRFRQASLGSGRSLVVRHSVFDTASVSMSDGTFEDNLIRHGSLSMVGTGSASIGHVTIDGGRIEDSPTTAFTYGDSFSGAAPTLTVLRTLRIAGSYGYPVDMPLSVFKQLWPTRSMQDSLLGNLNDTLSIWVDAATDALVRRELAWRIRGAASKIVNLGNLTIEPGGSLTTAGFLTLNLASLNAVGNSSDRIDISTLNPVLDGTQGININGPSRLSYVNVRNLMFINVGGAGAAQLDHITSHGIIHVSAPGSMITDTDIHDIGPSGVSFAGAYYAGLEIAGAGVTAQRIAVHRTAANVLGSPLSAVRINTDNVQLSDCEIADNLGDGVRVVSGTNIQVHNCNVERDGGFGVNNLTTSTVDARRNWWGDPSGPLGPNGDGVQGDVDYSQYLTAPFTFTVQSAIARSPRQ